MKKYVALTLVLIFVSLVITGCGETINGIGKDMQRVTKGFRMIFTKNER